MSGFLITGATVLLSFHIPAGSAMSAQNAFNNQLLEQTNVGGVSLEMPEAAIWRRITTRAVDCARCAPRWVLHQIFAGTGVTPRFKVMEKTPIRSVPGGRAPADTSTVVSVSFVVIEPPQQPASRDAPEQPKCECARSVSGLALGAWCWEGDGALRRREEVCGP